MMGQFYLCDPYKVPATWGAGARLQVCPSHVTAFNLECLSDSLEDTPLSHCGGEGEGEGDYHDTSLQKIMKMETGKWRSWKLNDG